MVIGIDGNEANVKNRVGVNQYAAELLSALYKLPEAKKHEWIIYLKKPPLTHLPKERKRWEYKILPGANLWVLAHLTPYLWTAARKPQVLFTPSHYTPPLLSFPQVLSIMDLGYLRYPAQFRKRDFIQLKYWGAWSMKRAKRIIAISKSTKQEIEEYYPWARGKVEVTYPGYDKDKFQFPISNSQVSKVKKKYGIQGDYTLFLSTLKPSKNVEGLLQAFSLLLTNINESQQKSNESANLTLVISGKKGWLYEDIFKLVQELDIEDRVIFTDFVPEEDKPALLAGARVFASPSFWEGFGMHVLEAMASSIPVVVSNIGSLPEIVQDAGILVDPYSPKDIARGLREVVTATQNRYNMLARKVVSQAEKFSWEKAARETLKILGSAA